MTRARLTTTFAALAALLVAFAGVPGLALADGHSPVDAMLEDEEDDSMLPSAAADVAKRVAGVVNTAEYSIESTLSDESDVTTASEQAKLTRQAFNERSGWVSCYNEQGYPTATSWEVIALHYEGESSTATDYLVQSYDSDGNLASAEIRDTYDGEVDAEQTFSGPLVHSYDEDTRETHELVTHVHSEYVENCSDITEDSAFLGELAKDYAGHTSGDLSP